MQKVKKLSPSAANHHVRRACVHDRRQREGGTLSPVGRLASTPVVDAPGGDGKKTCFVEVLWHERAGLSSSMKL